jgi:hypothetical protein
MEHKDVGQRSSDVSRGQVAEKFLAELFARAGGRVERAPGKQRVHRPDLVVRRGRSAYAVEVKAAPEGRSDRLVPLWSQAYLEAARAAGRRYAPLADGAIAQAPD